MESRDICEAALGLCVDQFRKIEAAVPPAKWTVWEDDFNWSFTEQLPSQIIVQKLARYITGLKSLDILLRAGLLQEVGVMFRMLDEIGEDISFLSLGIITGTWTKYHVDYAKYFWSEDEKMAQVRRNNIRSFVNRAFGQRDPSTAESVGRTIYKTYSDYVHARSAPIKGMIVGPPAMLDVSGILNSKARYPYVEQAPSYFYRGLISTGVAAKAMLSQEQASACFNEIKAFETEHSDKLF